eukprot:COSAG01_NODE_817_length_13376_cov_2.970101_3_plen_205_part_00
MDPAHSPWRWGSQPAIVTLLVGATPHSIDKQTDRSVGAGASFVGWAFRQLGVLSVERASNFAHRQPTAARPPASASHAPTPTAHLPPPPFWPFPAVVKGVEGGSFSHRCVRPPAARRLSVPAAAAAGTAARGPTAVTPRRRRPCCPPRTQHQCWHRHRQCCPARARRRRSPSLAWLHAKTAPGQGGCLHAWPINNILCHRTVDR